MVNGFLQEHSAQERTVLRIRTLARLIDNYGDVYRMHHVDLLALDLEDLTPILKELEFLYHTLTFVKSLDYSKESNNA